MDADEFVARMVAAGIPDMQLLPEVHSNAAPPTQLPSASQDISYITSQQDASFFCRSNRRASLCVSMSLPHHAFYMITLNVLKALYKGYPCLLHMHILSLLSAVHRCFQDLRLSKPLAQSPQLQSRWQKALVEQTLSRK